MSPLRRSVHALLLAAAAASALGAQQLRGTVFLPDGSTRTAGVIVELLDGRGTMVQRTLSGGRGEYLLRAPAAGRYAVRALRVGYRPTLLPAEEITLQAPSVRNIVLDPTPVTLGTVRVVAQDQCRLRPDSGQMVRRVWDEASKALLASRLANESGMLDAEWLTYRRWSDPAERLIRRQQIDLHRGPTATVFESRDADSLASQGYVLERGGVETFIAPDAAVLLSEPFAATHCLRLQAAGRDSSDLIGVHFEPIRRDRLRSDIAGVFWLDRATAELRALEFRYVGLSSGAEEAGAGGHLSFAHLSTGHWIIERWNLRLPALALEGTGPRIRASGGSLVITAVQNSGGVVTAVSRDGARLYSGSLPEARLQVTSTDPRHPAAGVAVRLEGTDYEGITDSTGRAVIPQVLEGTYRAGAYSPLIESVQSIAPAREITAGRSAASEPIALPTIAELVRSSCGPTADADGPSSILYGFVRDSLGRGLADVAVSASWITEAPEREGASARTDGVAIRSTDTGQWRLCAVPRNTNVTVRAETDAGQAAQSFSLDPDEVLHNTELDLRRATAENPDASPALLEVIVTGPSGAALNDVTLDIKAGRLSRRLKTSERGLALLANVPAGVVRISTRRLGFVAGELAIIARPGRNTVPIHLDASKPPALDTIRVMGSRRIASRLDEFELRHQRKQATASFDRAAIEKKNPVDVWQMLTAVPSISITAVGGQIVAKGGRGKSTSILADRPNQPCYMRVVLDGKLIPTQQTADGFDYTDLSRLPPPAEIHGIEYFAGPASIPPQYGGFQMDKGCGLIAIWTR